MSVAVRAGGPAARAGIVVGDRVIGVDGHAVTGDDMRLFFSLSRVPVGTKLALALARGAMVELTADRAR